MLGGSAASSWRCRRLKPGTELRDMHDTANSNGAIPAGERHPVVPKGARNANRWGPACLTGLDRSSIPSSRTPHHAGMACGNAATQCAVKPGAAFRVRKHHDLRRLAA
jgi:hypothetical protein